MFDLAASSRRITRLYIYSWTGVEPDERFDAGLTTLRRRIALRGRSYEQDIPDAYLAGLNRLYDAWIADFDACPVLRVPGDELDFVADPHAFGRVCERIQAHGFGLPLLR